MFAPELAARGVTVAEFNVEKTPATGAFSSVFTYTYFPALRCRSRIRFRKNRVRTCRSVCRCWGVCAAVARLAQEAGRQVSRANEWAELHASWLLAPRQVRKNRTRSTATANLRKRRTLFFYVSYTEFLRNSYTDERNSYELFQRRYGNGGTDT